MPDGSKKQSRIWVYAVILFSSAFIVLLLTAYSQIKLNNSLSEYKSKLDNMELQHDNAKFSLNAAIELNAELSKKIDELNEELEAADKKIKEYEELLEREKEKNKLYLSSYEALINAHMEYEKGNFIDSALLLQEHCDPDHLNNKALEMYTDLKNKVYKEASYKLYTDGYNLYKNKAYGEAIKSFKLSLSLTGSEYYSDDCYYFMAYSYYFINDHEQARQTAQTLLEKYPESTYKNATEELLRMIG